MAKIILLTGSLGVGKTTTLLHITKQVSVDEIIVSDAARINVDATRTQAKKSLQGCACCVALPELKKYLRDKEGTILIEASGLSQSDGISQAIAKHQTCWIHLVNAATYNNQQLSTSLKKFLGRANIVLVNKTDKASHTKELLKEIKQHSSARIISTTKGVFDTKHIDYTLHSAAKRKQRKHDQKAISVSLPGKISTQDLEKYVSKYPRAKGWYMDDKNYSFDKTEIFEHRKSTVAKNTISIIGIQDTFDAINTTLKLIGASKAPMMRKLAYLLKQVPEVIWDMR